MCGAVAYTILALDAARRSGEGISISTFGIWAMIAWITAITTNQERGNPYVPALYATGATTVTIILVFHGRWGWTSFDSIVFVLVVVCLGVWSFLGSRPALIMSVLAATIASLPYILMTWKDPLLSPIVPNSLFLATNVLSFFAAKRWTVEDRLYAGASALQCIALVVPRLIS